jgi:hypothetical protein
VATELVDRANFDVAAIEVREEQGQTVRPLFDLIARGRPGQQQDLVCDLGGGNAPGAR